MSFPGVADSIEASDLVLNIGPLPSDSNTGGFTREIKDEHQVWLGHDFCKVQDQAFDGVHFLPVLKIMVESAALYLFVETLLLALNSVHHNAQFIVLECVTPIVVSPRCNVFGRRIKHCVYISRASRSL